MSYTDTNTHIRVNPVGLGGALLVSGVMIAGLATMAPEIIESLPDGPFTLIDTSEPAPPPKPLEQKPAKQTETKVTVPPRGSDAGPVTTNTLDLVPLDKEPVTVDPPVKPDIIADPVRVPVRAGAVMISGAAAQPPYPRSLQAEGVEGVAVVRVLVGVDGRVRAVELVRADDPLFYDATREQALRKWRFRPATEDGRAVEGWREMTVRFVMPR